MSKLNNNGLIRDIKKAFTRLFKACNENNRFLAYIIVGVVGLGGAGIWIPALGQNGSWMTLVDTNNHFTYAIAILFSLCIERILTYEKDDSNENLIGLAVISGFIATVLVSIGYAKNNEYCAVIGTCISILVLSITYANDPRFYEKSENQTNGITPPIGPQTINREELTNQQGNN